MVNTRFLVVAGVVLVLVPRTALALCEVTAAVRASPTCGAACTVVVEQVRADPPAGFPRFTASGQAPVAARVVRTSPSLYGVASVRVRAEQPLVAGGWNLEWDDTGTPPTRVNVVAPNVAPPVFTIRSAGGTSHGCDDEGSCGGSSAATQSGVLVTTSLEGEPATIAVLGFDLWVLPAGSDAPMPGADGEMVPPPTAEFVNLGGAYENGARASTLGIDAHPPMEPGSTHRVFARLVMLDGQTSALASADLEIFDGTTARRGCTHASPAWLLTGALAWLLLPWRRRRTAADGRACSPAPPSA